ncbi:lytic transglycosylase domain-containing protein [Pseudomonadales bacterium]|nr:lytic transglycosylase domain-containing protein [Pseudomonadales bacterium]
MPSLFIAKRLTTLLCLFSISISSVSLASNNRTQQIDDAELKTFLQNTLGKDTALKDKFDGEVWLLGMRARMAAYKISDKESYSILTTVYQEALNSGLAPDIVLAVIAAESSFNRFAVSSAGAQGLMQVMPFWKNEIGRADDNLTDIATNIRYGCKILQFYLQKEKGNLALALARYNGSVGQTRYSEKVLVIWEQHWRSGRL